MKREKGFNGHFRKRGAEVLVVYKTDYEAGKEYMEHFVKLREKAKRAEELYLEALQVKSASSYSGDRVQTGRTGDPTYAAVVRTAFLREKYKRCEDTYYSAIVKLDKVLKRISPHVLRLVVVLYYMDRRTIPELAKILVKRDGTGYSPETVKKLKHQALAEIGKTIRKAPE